MLRVHMLRIGPLGSVIGIVDDEMGDMVILIGISFSVYIIFCGRVMCLDGLLVILRVAICWERGMCVEEVEDTDLPTGRGGGGYMGGVEDTDLPTGCGSGRCMVGVEDTDLPTG